MSATILDQEPVTDNLLHDAIKGLQQTPRQLPCKYFYDRKGAELFEQICELPEYYPTRTELSIMQDHADEMADLIGTHARIVEYGSGEGLKTRLLLDALVPAMSPAAYIPIDISKQQLQTVAAQLKQTYPELPILPLCADYTTAFDLPEPVSATGAADETINNEATNEVTNQATQPAYAKTVVYFPGSTIGNFPPEQAGAFLRNMLHSIGTDKPAGLLIGVDLKKTSKILEAAYNDQAGVTAAFNLNLLTRLNNECGANFVVEDFAHKALFNQASGAVEMHLVSKSQQTVQLNGNQFEFTAGDSIHTENSFKYTLDEFAALAASAGWQRQQLWLDSNQWFSVQYFIPEANGHK